MMDMMITRSEWLGDDDVADGDNCNDDCNEAGDGDHIIVIMTVMMTMIVMTMTTEMSTALMCVPMLLAGVDGEDDVHVHCVDDKY